MGGLFGKSKPDVTAHDRAVLDLKVQRDRLTSSRKKIEGIIEKETQMAVTLAKQGQRDKALRFLKRKKQQAYKT